MLSENLRSKLETLFQIDQRSQSAWNQPGRDSLRFLAEFTLRMPEVWSESDIKKLLISHREKHDENITNGEVEEIIQEEKESDPQPEESSQKHALSDTLGIPPIKTVWKISGGQETQYTLVLENGKKVTLGDVGVLDSQTKFGRKLMDQLGVVIPEFPRDEWLNILQKILDLSEPPSSDESTPLMERLQRWITAYLDDDPPPRNPHPDVRRRAAVHHRPFRKDGNVWVSTMGLKEFVEDNFQESPSLKKLARHFRLAGFEHDPGWSFRLGKSHTRAIWKVPKSFLGDHGR